MNTRRKKPKWWPEYSADVPALTVKNNQEDEEEAKKNVILHDVPIPIEYFELKHFYSAYQDSFDYADYVKQKRRELKKQSDKMQKLLAKEAKFRRSKRFKQKNHSYLILD